MPSVLFVTAQRAGAAVSGLPHGRRVAPAPRVQLYVRCVGPCRARGGCRAPVSCASVAQGAVCCECAVLVRCLYSGLVGGLPFIDHVALLACVGGLAFVFCAFG